MKKLLILLLTCGFGLQAAPTWSDVSNALDKITFGDARRYVWDGALSVYNGVACTASDTANWTLEVAAKTSENGAYVHRSFIIPALQSTYAGTCETLSAGKDMAGLAKDTGYAMGKFIYDHPQVTLVLGAAATIYYLSRSAQGVVEEQYLKLQKVIDNTLAQANQFELTVTNQEAERRILLSACDIYIPVTYNLDLGLYRNEARAIDEYLNQMRILKNYLTRHQDHALIQSQAKAVQDAARLVQYILIKRLNLNAARMVLAKR
ncbi:MAG: hypothetical protein K2X90_04410 [Candidatus Babeliaceae bacterium]|nr:hypothetical protein [Candidatus Babeliaceae bacterium]